MADWIEQTKAFVKETLREAEGGHDWHHIQRVYANALRIAKGEADVDLKTVQLAALLHDIADSKFHNGDEAVGPRMAGAFLERIQVDVERKKEVVAIIENISFKGGNFQTEYNSKELQVVQDADRLDAIGAIGIARAFNYGGYKNRPIYDPDIEPRMGMTKEEYKKYAGPTINHFYEKLLLLKDLMHTQTGRELAEKRHRYMENFLSQFYAECDGLL